MGIPSPGSRLPIPPLAPGSRSLLWGPPPATPSYRYMYIVDSYTYVMNILYMVQRPVVILVPE